MHAVRVSWPSAADVSRSSTKSGSPGRYMSIASGPNVDSSPRMTTVAAPARTGGRTTGSTCIGGDHVTVARGAEADDHLRHQQDEHEPDGRRPRPGQIMQRAHPQRPDRGDQVA